MKRLVIALSAIAVTGAVVAGSGPAAAVPTAGAVAHSANADTYTFDFDNEDDIAQHDDGYTSGYWVSKVDSVSHSPSKSVKFTIRTFGSQGRVWIDLDTTATTQSTALPVTISFWVRTGAGAASADAQSNPWEAAAYADTVPTSDGVSHAPTAGWRYQQITHTPGTWQKYTLTTTVDNSVDPTVYTAVGIQARWPAPTTVHHYLDDVTVTLG